MVTVALFALALAHADPLRGSFTRVGVSCGYRGVETMDPVQAARLDFTPEGQVLVDLTNHADCRILRWGTFETSGRLLTLHLTGGCGACPTHGITAPENAFAGDVTADFTSPAPDHLLLFRHDARLDRALCPSAQVLMRRFARADDARAADTVRAEVCSRRGAR